MDIKKDDLYVVGVNQRGVHYLYEWETGEVIAKQCTECGGWFFLDGFNKAGKGFAGTHSLCKECHRKRNQQFQKDKAEAEFERLKEMAYQQIKQDVFGEVLKEQNQVKRSLRNW